MRRLSQKENRVGSNPTGGTNFINIGMIKVHTDINADQYCYDTGLNFGYEVGQELLQSVLYNESQFERRKNYYKIDDYKGLVRKVGAEKTREIIRRQLQSQKMYAGQTPIEFRQYFFNDYFKQKLLSTIPEWLKVSDTEPDCMLQVGDSGSFLPPHCGHHRKCSLFMLLQADDQETSWYRPTEDFETIDALRIPDIDKIELCVSVVMQVGKWYMFNNKEWHSVQKYSQGKKRISMGLDFHSIHGIDLVNLIKSHQ